MSMLGSTAQVYRQQVAKQRGAESSTNISKWPQITFNVGRTTSDAINLVATAMDQQGFAVTRTTLFKGLECFRPSSHLHDYEMRLQFSFAPLTQNTVDITIRDLSPQFAIISYRWADRRMSRLQKLMELTLSS